MFMVVLLLGMSIVTPSFGEKAETTSNFCHAVNAGGVAANIISIWEPEFWIIALGFGGISYSFCTIPDKSSTNTDHFLGIIGMAASIASPLTSDTSIDACVGISAAVGSFIKGLLQDDLLIQNIFKMTGVNDSSINLMTQKEL